MFIYFANILLVIVWALIFCRGNILAMDEREKRDDRTRLKRMIFVVLCFAQSFFIAAVRKGVGWDYVMYGQGFVEMYREGFSNLQHFDWEIGFVILNKVIALFTPYGHVFFAVTSFLSLIGPFWLILRYSRNEFLSMFIYLNMWFLYMNMNFIRQAMAISILCFAYPFIKNRKFWRFLAIVLLASLFHASVLYMIPVYFVLLLKAEWKTLMLYLGALIAYFLFSDAVLDFVLKRWHTEYYNSQFINDGVDRIYSILACVICGGVILMLLVFKKKPQILQLSIHFALLTFFWQVVMVKHSLFERFSYYSMIFLMLCIPECIFLFEKRYKKYLRAKLRKTSTFVEGGVTVNSKAEKVTAFICLGYMLLLWAYNAVCLLATENGCHGCKPYMVMYDYPINDLFQLF